MNAELDGSARDHAGLATTATVRTVPPTEPQIALLAARSEAAGGRSKMPAQQRMQGWLGGAARATSVVLCR